MIKEKPHKYKVVYQMCVYSETNQLIGCIEKFPIDTLNSYFTHKNHTHVYTCWRTKCWITECNIKFSKSWKINKNFMKSGLAKQHLVLRWFYLFICISLLFVKGILFGKQAPYEKLLFLRVALDITLLQPRVRALKFDTPLS